jgi:hypothetical protein
VGQAYSLRADLESALVWWGDERLIYEGKGISQENVRQVQGRQSRRRGARDLHQSEA